MVSWRQRQRIGWEAVVNSVRGESNLAQAVRRLPHKTARLLEHLRRRGAGVTLTTKPWAIGRRDDAIARGAHKSAHMDCAFVFDEMGDFCEQQGCWIALPYSVVRNWPNLRVSPIGAVPERDRRPRLIVDYSFSELNAETLQLAPAEAMQFGRALNRILKRILEADPRYDPVQLAKIDIADGFYRVWVQFNDVPKLGVALPTSPGEPPLIAFPLTLPMVWVELPPYYFTVLTETVCDLENVRLRQRAATTTTHRLETIAATTPPSDDNATHAALLQERTCLSGRLRSDKRCSEGCPPTAYVDVYVDDFLLMAQTVPQQTRAMQTKLDAIDQQVFRPLAAHDPSHRKEPASVKKMLNGDACWATTKRMVTRAGPPPNVSWGGTSTPRLRPSPCHPISWSASSNCSTPSALHTNACRCNAGTNCWGNSVPCPQHFRAPGVSSPSSKTPCVEQITIECVLPRMYGIWRRTFGPSPTRCTHAQLGYGKSCPENPFSLELLMRAAPVWATYGVPAPRRRTTAPSCGACAIRTCDLGPAQGHHLHLRSGAGCPHRSQGRARPSPSDSRAHHLDGHGQ